MVRITDWISQVLGKSFRRIKGMTRMRKEVRLSDVEKVKSIVHSTGFFTPEEIDMAGELLETYLKQGETSGYRFLFMDEGRETVAYACYGEISCAGGRYDLYWIAVDPGRQGKGYGKSLLEGVEEEVIRLGGQKIFIETSSRLEYKPTRLFYRRRGYHLEAVIRDFYSWGDHKVIYSKIMPGFTKTADTTEKRIRASKIRKVWVQKAI